MSKLSPCYPGRSLGNVCAAFLGASLVITLLLLTSEVLCAQEYNFRTFGITEGLNNLAVSQVYQDRAGFIWVSLQSQIGGRRLDCFVFQPGES